MPDLKDKFRRLRELGPEAVAGIALGTFGVIAAAVTVTAIVESYSNLVTFGLNHGMVTWHGAIAPIAVDAFILMGELMLVGGILKHWAGKSYYAFAGLLVFGGFAMSVGGNVLRSTALPVWADRAVQAIWPITATAALTGCLVIIKRLMAERQPVTPGRADPRPRSPAPPPAPQPSRREPRPARAAREPGLAAAFSAAEQQLLDALVSGEQEWIGEQKASRLTGIPRRRVQQVFAAARAASNGGGHDDRDES